MLTLLGFLMIATFLTLIMMKRMSPLAALVLIPALFCVLAGQATSLGDYVLKGIGELAPTAAMLMFAIIYFGVMIDVGLFDPIVRGILRFCKADPMRVVIGTAVLAAVVSLDGDGSTTFMITVSAMLPLYRRLKMSVLVMTGIAATANGVMNTVPWGGPTARVATALKLDPSDVFVPMIPALACGLVFVFFLAWILGLRERKRLGTLTLDGPEGSEGAGEESGRILRKAEAAEETEREAALAGAGGRTAGARGGSDALPGGIPAPRSAGGAGDGVTDGPDERAAGGPHGRAVEDPAGEAGGLDPHRATLRPKLFWFNAALTVALLTTLITQLLPIPVLFLLGAAIALTVNFPHMKDQKARIAAHADNVLNVSGMVFAAAVFTGVLTGTGMVEDMARNLVSALPDGLGPYMSVVTAVLSIPFTYFMSNDGFYFGIVPILAEAGGAHGVSAVEIARASLVGQVLHMSSPLVPAVYVLIGMAKVEFGDHTRFTVKWATLTSLVVLGAGLLFGIL
ncbi:MULTISPECIES: citrate:proton symporter [unclassified Streptomyces]|uniref:CitMHS family transporter n=1 Tax=unclassified Streptomyces TaxID=2593676 RepID=UPI002DDBD2EB|nr:MULTISPECIES: citrate:proton symporter [unclassified Streptomyces]WSA95788.1 citrate:proton symporter [Streptomyces sp. NBC_01795]WSB80208.1 citrate:proton symporter [Streptomyces sp. NBC_01775]WSS11584.1 citrate:proton symporter [Streptomyces sp. NBC_01186]WSS40299.1 citrate:proton symporter [Streptomyces sp. NBC_01187]